MPTYQYRCTTCAHGFERFQRFSEAPLTECPVCGGTVRRVIHPVGVVFKGSGWYITDSRKPATTDGDGAAKSDAKPETKPETKTETKPAEKAKSASTSKEPVAAAAD